MQTLIRGIHRFQSEIFDSQRSLFERLEVGQQPEALFITCSDSRINPNLVTQTEPGELFILRNAGNIISPCCDTPSGEAATIEYAVRALKIRDIILCGHSHCGAMEALMNPNLLEGLPSVSSWLQYAEETRRIVSENYTHLSGDALLTATAEENVLVQLKHLRTLPAVAEALENRTLSLHGWVYKFETGQVFAYDHEEHAFLPITEATGASG